MKDDVAEKAANVFLERFGKATDGRAKYRVVWAPDQLEKRLSDFAMFHGALYLGTSREMREVPKYSYLPECYVLEELIFGQELDEVPDSKSGIYEPLYTFASAAGIPLPLSLNVLDIVMYAKMHPKNSSQIFHDNRHTYEEQVKRQHQIDMDAVDTTVLLTRMHHGECNFTKGVANVGYKNK